MIERWKDVPGYKGYYQVSDAGRVRSLSRIIIRSNGYPQTVRNRILKLSVGTYGHVQVLLCRIGHRVTRTVHQLVLEAFIGRCPKGLEACHNDGVHVNNQLLNLRWDTHKSNMEDMGRHGLRRVLPVRRSDGKLYESCKAAAKAVGVHRSSVSRSIYCGQHCAGYTWEFINV